MNTEKQRWQYRFDNFRRAYTLLLEALDILYEEKLYEEKLNQLGKEGMIKRFEYCTELAWKTIKDYLENQSVILLEITPRTVLKEAIAAKVIERGDDWMSLLDARNEMNHHYDFRKFEEVIREIEERYILCFSELHQKLIEVEINEQRI